MAGTAYPTVIAAAMSTFDAAIGEDVARVVRGRDLSEASGDVVMVGVAELEGGDWESAGGFDQEFQTFAGARHETGRVNCLATAWRANSDQDAATAAACALVAACADAVRATPNLGITTFDYLVLQMVSGEVLESQANGATTSVPFTIQYDARI